MATNSTKRERRDWTLIILLLPVGIILMLIAGQIAIRLVPSWSVDGGMQSSLDPETASKNELGQIQPISFSIFTPMSWFGSYLTPRPDSGDGIFFAPFIVLEPSLTPSPTTSPTATDTPVTPTATATTTGTSTKKPPDDDDTPTPPTTCTDPAATNNGGPLPCTYPPTTCTDPLATNFGGPLPCTYPPTTCTDPLATNFGGPLPCTYPPTTCTDPLANNNGGPLPCIYPSPTPLVGAPTATPSEYNYGAPDGSVGGVPNGNYVIINLTANPIIVNGPVDTNYDFVYYERDTGIDVDMDRVILSISSDGATYYVVFNWGDGVPDSNSNVGDVAGAENDNQNIPYSELHNDTGILVDVDNAPSNPPVATYQWLAVQAPTPPPGAIPPNDSTDGADVDSVEVIEVTPTP